MPANNLAVYAKTIIKKKEWILYRYTLKIVHNSKMFTI